METIDTSNFSGPKFKLQLVQPERRKTTDIETLFDDSHLPDDPLEDMLRGIEIDQYSLDNQEAQPPRNLTLVTKEGIQAQKLTKQLRFYLNEISMHLELDV